MEEISIPKKIASFLFRLVRVIVVLIVAAFIAKFLFDMKEKPEKQEIVKTPPSVKVMTANASSKVMTVEAYGTVKPRKLVKIAVEVPGRIEYIHPSFIEGGKINKGDLLIKIDQRSYKLDRQAGLVRIKQARTDIESFKQDVSNLENDIELSKENVKLAKKELKRVKALTKNQFASKNSLDKVEQQHLQAKIGLQNIQNRYTLTDTLMEQKVAALAMARVDYQKADLAYQKTQIYAQFDGLVLEKYAESGEYVNPGQMLGSIYQKGNLDVDVRIPLEKMRWIESIFESGTTPKATIVIANSNGGISYTWNARVARVKAKIDETTRTLPMTLEIETTNKEIKELFNIKPGTFVKCSIMGETFNNVFMLPRYLLKRNDTVFVVQENKLKIKQVSVLRKFENEVFINEGLTPGDKIISSPLPGALEGMELTIKENGN